MHPVAFMFVHMLLQIGTFQQKETADILSAPYGPYMAIQGGSIQ